MLGLGARAEGTAALAGSRDEAMLQRQVGYLLSGFWISRCRKLVFQVLGLPFFLCSCHSPWHFTSRDAPWWLAVRMLIGPYMANAAASSLSWRSLPAWQA